MNDLENAASPLEEAIDARIARAQAEAAARKMAEAIDRLEALACELESRAGMIDRKIAAAKIRQAINPSRKKEQ